ncbi:carbohydrate ABC transporter membrane protein 2 (CUT1 family) [Halanaerobium saccharolyticum]|uniref:Carbohydrate ABC transporter membrane protein 2 (CUT1 family) n=1 Tax=Halanaerobium saccharolyticum TaxID=43595 RepID=A0A4R6M1R5_9FIRM|nr:carbohydrate ABC transporter permease [Halanaerobium saccharolyticum]TDO95178.1 carbohydrate ABC transporter membrane protein 2 (CUT1 family) [Halanaerobium saccharolyticum]
MKFFKNKLNSGDNISLWQYLFLGAYILFSLFPIYWIIITAFKNPSAVLELPVNWIPENPTIDNFIYVFRERPYLSYTINSVVAALSSTLLCVVLGTPAAYSFSRYDFKGNKVMFFSVLVSRMIPPIALIVPFYSMMQNLGLIDTKIALIITYSFFNLPFVIWVMKSYFDEIPTGLDEAARIDGASKWQIFKDVILPVTLPGIAASAMLAFIFSWNEFVFTLVLTLTPAAKTLPIGLMDFIADDFIDWARLMAGGALAATPAIIFGLFFQKYIVGGLTKGAIKE